MKTFFTALVAIAITSTVSATHLHRADCPANCSDKVAAVCSSAKSYEQKVADLQHAASEKNSLINYNKAMQRTLNLIAKQKHLDAIANIESENAFNNLMSGVIINIEQESLMSQLEDLDAGQRFTQIMQVILPETE